MSDRVGVPRGATQDLILTPSAPASATIMRYDDEATGLQALISGQIDLVGTGLLVSRALNRNEQCFDAIQLVFIHLIQADNPRLRGTAEVPMALFAAIEKPAHPC